MAACPIPQSLAVFGERPPLTMLDAMNEGRRKRGLPPIQPRKRDDG